MREPVSMFDDPGQLGPAAQLEAVAKGLRSHQMKPSAALSHLDSLESELIAWGEQLEELTPPREDGEEARVWTSFLEALQGLYQCVSTVRDWVQRGVLDPDEMHACVENALEHEAAVKMVHEAYADLLEDALDESR